MQHNTLEYKIKKAENKVFVAILKFIIVMVVALKGPFIITYIDTNFIDIPTLTEVNKFICDWVYIFFLLLGVYPFCIKEIIKDLNILKAFKVENELVLNLEIKNLNIED